jgi:hypothetical protein
MIIFLDEERAYLSWVTHHRAGYVLDTLRNPSKKHGTLHRATCSQTKRADSKRTHWTTGRHMKACSLQLDELVAWFAEQTGAPPADCPQCQPSASATEQDATHHSEPHLTKLARDVLSFVLEVATIHLDQPDEAYSLDVGDIARCFGKTPGQLAAVFLQLVDDDLISTAPPVKPEHALSPRQGVWPTVRGLRTLAVYAELDDALVEAELRKLHEA